jgi:hypothetical protein
MFQYREVHAVFCSSRFPADVRVLLPGSVSVAGRAADEQRLAKVSQAIASF